MCYVQAIITECVHTTGLYGLVYWVLPQLDVVSGILLFNASALFIPSLLQSFCRPAIAKRRHTVNIIIDVVTVIISVSALVTWPILSSFLPVSGPDDLCIYDNFTDQNSNMIKIQSTYRCAISVQ